MTGKSSYFGFIMMCVILFCLFSQCTRLLALMLNLVRIIKNFEKPDV